MTPETEQELSEYLRRRDGDSAQRGIILVLASRSGEMTPAEQQAWLVEIRDARQKLDRIEQAIRLGLRPQLEEVNRGEIHQATTDRASWGKYSAANGIADGISD